MSGQHRAIREKPAREPGASIRERIRDWLQRNPLREPDEVCPRCGQVVHVLGDLDPLPPLPS